MNDTRYVITCEKVEGDKLVTLVMLEDISIMARAPEQFAVMGNHPFLWNTYRIFDTEASALIRINMMNVKRHIKALTAEGYTNFGIVPYTRPRMQALQ